jgi:hypothetical protein
MRPLDFERKMYEFAQQFADPNASHATRVEIENKAVGLLHDQGYTWNPVTNREFSFHYFKTAVFQSYVERVMGYVPIMPGAGYSFANGWRLSEQGDGSTDKDGYNRNTHYLIENRTNPQSPRWERLSTNEWYAYWIKDKVYVARKGAKPNGRDGVALELRGSADKPLVNHPSVARNAAGRRIEAHLNGL